MVRQRILAEEMPHATVAMGAEGALTGASRDNGEFHLEWAEGKCESVKWAEERP